MAGTSLGTAYVQIVPKADGISGAISNVLGGEATTAGTKAGRLFSGGFAGKVAKGAAVAGAALAGGIALGTAALKKGIQETAAYGDSVDKMSQKIGFSTDEYQKWDYVMQLAGTDMSKMAPVMKTLSNQAASNSAAFQELGISEEEVANMSPEQLFSTTISKLSEMENQTERTALASKLLGRGATELGPLMNQGSAAIEEQMAVAERYGMIMPEAAVKASAAFQDSVTTMQMTMTGLKNRMMAEFLPSVTQITDGLGKMFAGDMSGADDVAAGIQGIANKIVEMAPVVWEAAKRVGGQLIQGFMDKAPELSQNAGVLIGKLITSLIEKLPTILATGAQLILGLAKGLIQSLPSIISAVGRIGTQIISGLGSKIWGRVKAAAQGIKERFMQPIESLKEKIKGIVEKIKGFFNFNIPTPHVPLPHFTISPAGWKLSDLLKGVKPSLSVSWYAKGGIVDGATLIGAGEKGPEAIVPLDSFWKKLEQTAGAGDNITINVYANEGMDVNAVASAVEQRLIQMQRRRTMAWQ